jgi:hypothetical protein
LQDDASDCTECPTGIEVSQRKGFRIQQEVGTVNTCTFIGEVVDEPKRGTYGQGKTLLSWRMHVKHGQEPYERSCFVSFKAFSRVADSLPYLDTGATRQRCAGHQWRRQACQAEAG